MHELEGSINPTPFQKTIEGDENMYDTLPRAISPLHEEIPLSREDQDLRSLIIDEVFSNIDEEKEHEASNSVVTSEEGPSPHGDGNEAITSRGGDFSSFQKVPKEHHVTIVMGCNYLIKTGEEKVDQIQRMGSMHPCLFQGVYVQKKETDLCSKGREK